MKVKQFLSKVFIFITVCCFINSCSTENTPSIEDDPLLKETKNTPSYGGELKLIENEIYSNIFPYSLAENVAYRIVSQIHCSLLKMNAENLKIEPSIAKSWEVNDEQTKYTFHLRNDVFFHKDTCYKSKDSARLKASDVAFTFELICSKYYNSGYNLLLNNLLGAKDFHENKANSIEGLKILNDTTIVFELIEPSPTIVYILSSAKTAIISEKAYNKYGTSLKNGCGAFMFGGLDEDSSYIYLTKNDDFFAKDKNGGDLPYLDTVTIKINKENQDPTSLFIEDGIMVLYDVTEAKVESLFEKYHSDFDDKKFIVDRKAIIATDCYEFNISKAPFNNPKVRKAFSYAVNRKSLIDNILKGQGKIGNKGIVPIVNTFKQYNYDTIVGYHYDPIKAKRYLAEAGYPNGEGFPEVVLELALGHPIQIDAAKEVQNQLSNVLNITITIEQEKMNSLIKRAVAGSSQMNHFTWLSEYPSPLDFLNVFYGSNELEENGESWPNTSRYVNKKYNALLEKALITSDLKERYALYTEAETILMDDAPVLILWYPEVYNIVHDYVKNLHFNEMLHYDYSKVYIKK